MKHELFFLVLFAFLLVISVSAADLSEDDVNGTVTVATAAPSSDPTDSSVETLVSETTGEVTQDETGINALDIDGSLAGGYYFLCDCSLGHDLKFYVPFEWAYDVFTFDSSGAPVNLSNSTCYAYCPDYPDYTFSCSRFGTFTYRSSNYSSEDLEITNISDTNITFLEDESRRLSESDILILIAGMVFLFGVAAFILRR